MRVLASVLAAGIVCAPSAAHAQWAYKGNLGQEVRQFDHSTAPGQVESNWGLFGELQGSYTAGESWKFAGQVFARGDVKEDDRNAVRIDELWVQYSRPNWELRVGNQVFNWGSMEVFGITDILNSRDYLQNVVTPRKIGQPAVRSRWSWGNKELSLYYLPYLFPASYPGQSSRYSVGGTVFSRADAGAEQAQQFAGRFFVAGNGFDLGLVAFSGLERDSLFDSDLVTRSITSRSYHARRIGVDVTKVAGSVLLKTEVVFRDAERGSVDDSFIWSAGAELARPSVMGNSDLTVYAEIAGENQARPASDFELSQDNLYLGARWEFNDRRRQNLDVGWVKNYRRGSGYWALAAQYSVRVAEKLKVELEYQELAGFSVKDPVGNTRSVRLGLSYDF